jgi:hypothetical protein
LFPSGKFKGFWVQHKIVLCFFAAPEALHFQIPDRSMILFEIENYTFASLSQLSKSKSIGNDQQNRLVAFFGGSRLL